MELRTYLLTLDKAQVQSLADSCKTSPGHLRNCAYGLRKPAPELALAIERVTKRQVTRQELLPTKYRAIWPDLKAA